MTRFVQFANSGRTLDREKAFDALGVSVVEEYGEWKPEDAPLGSFHAMHKGQVQIVGGDKLSDKIA
jgi:xanthine dehydrogenase YagR molybdenum-binding subunit